MMIVIHAGDTLAAYTQAYSSVATRRPPACPGCRVAGRMTSLGRYPRRKPLEGRAEVPDAYHENYPAKPTSSALRGTASTRGANA
jgi:hypothetical protein